MSGRDHDKATRALQQELEALRADIDQLRTLAEADPDSHLPGLASELYVLATWLDAEGLRERGRAAMEEAVSLYRELAMTHPGAYVIELAQALDRNGTILRQLDRRDEALVVWHEAALEYMTLDADSRAELSLGRTLSEMATCMYELGHREKALDTLRMAEVVQKAVIPTQPGWALADLATTLSRALLILDDVGEPEHALEIMQHLVNVRKQLVAMIPHFLPDLGVSLIALGRRLDVLGRHDKASAVMREAATLRPRLVMMASRWPFWLEFETATRPFARAMEGEQ